MRRVVQAVVLGLVLMALAPAIAVAGGNANFLIGERELTDQWFPVDSQLMVGATVDWGMDDWPVHLAWGLNVSVDDRAEYRNDRYSAMFAEVSFGVLWLSTRHESFRPYVGAGIASRFADLEIVPDDGTGTLEIDGQEIGCYVNAGAYWRLGPSFNLGLDLRYGMGAEFDLVSQPGGYVAGAGVRGNYLAFSMLLGFGWGK